MYIFIISEACIKNHKLAKMAEVDDAVIEFLQHCPHKRGGPKYKVSNV